MSLDNLKAKMKEKFKERFVVDLNEVFKQALPESEGWEHGTNAKPFIKQMTDAEEVEHFISEQVEEAFKAGQRDTAKDILRYGQVALEPKDEYRDYYIVRIHKSLLISMTKSELAEEEAT